MGILRLLLAIIVVIYHAKELHLYTLLDQTSAILSFFVISGFYMALILDGKYHKKFIFYMSRFLRIFPLYWAALIITVLLGLLKTSIFPGQVENSITHYIHYSSHLSGNAAIFEALNFISRNITLIITTDYIHIVQNLAPGYLIVNPAWTLQVELLFYLIVPFLLRITKGFLAFTLFYVFLFYGIITPFNLLPQSSLLTIFASYLIYFLLGICSYKYIYKRIEKKKISPNTKYLLGAFFLFIIFYQILPFKFAENNFPFNAVYFVPFAILISYLFHYTKNSKIDRFIGELSYPVYITHMIFVKLIFSFPIPSVPYLNSLLICCLTIIFSLFLVKFIQTPIDNFRHRKF